MTSAYERDATVPPARIDRIGKHRKVATHVLMALPAPEADEGVHPSRLAVRSGETGPTYEDFLRSDRRATAPSHRTG
jgi:hypothetical protein